MNLKNRLFLIVFICCFLMGMNTQSVYAKSISPICVKPITEIAVLAGCADSTAIAKIIGDAIELGAPIYNAGFHIGCYRVYEWAAYKIVSVYGSNCKDVEKILKSAIEKSHGDYSDIEKAWLMRAAFDKILGEPTTPGKPEKESPERTKPIKG